MAKYITMGAAKGQVKVIKKTDDTETILGFYDDIDQASEAITQDKALSQD